MGANTKKFTDRSFQMNIQEIIAKKRDNQKLTKEEIKYFITRLL